MAPTSAAADLTLADSAADHTLVDSAVATWEAASVVDTSVAADTLAAADTGNRSDGMPDNLKDPDWLASTNRERRKLLPIFCRLEAARNHAEIVQERKRESSYLPRASARSCSAISEAARG